MDYKMIIFDMDGTIVSVGKDFDYLLRFHRVYKSVLHKMTGRDFSHLTGEDLYRPIALSNEASREILKSWGVKDFEKFWKTLTKEDLKTRLSLRGKITTYPDAVEMLRMVPKETRKVILTNSPPEIAEMQLKVADLERGFDKVYAFRYNETNSKPSPWAIQHEMKRYNILPHEVAMIGDNYCDTNTGLNAGVVTAQLYRVNHQHSQESNPHVKGKNLVEIWNGLLELNKEKFDEM